MATSNIGALNVKITSDTSGLDSGVKKSKTGLASVGTAATKSAVKITKWGAAAAAAASVAAAAIIKANLSTIDSLAKTADKLDITTEALQGLQHAAELTGVSVGTMETSLQRMTRRISEAAQGTGVAVNALDELGIAMEDIQNLSADEQLLVVADAMEGVTSQSDKLRLSIALFDTEGAAMVNTLNGGSEALKGMMNEVNELGFAISRLDAAKIEQANDSILRMGRLIEGLGTKFTVALSPYITAATKQLAEMGKKGILSTKSIENGINNVAMAGAWLADSFRGIGIVIDMTKTAVFGLGYAYAEIKKVALGAFKAINNGFVTVANAGITAAESVSNGFLYMGNQITKAYQTVKFGVLSVIQSISIAFDAMINSAKAGVNSLIEGMNTIPGVDIEVMETGASETTKKISDAIAATEKEIASLNKGIQPVEMERLVPSDSFDDALRDVNQFGNDMYMEMNQALWDASNAANEKPMTEIVSEWMADAKKASDAALAELSLGGTVDADGVSVPSVSTDEPEESKAIFTYEQETIGLLEAMNMRFSSQEEAQLAAIERQQELLDQQYAQGLLSQEQFNEQSVRLTRQAEEAKRAIVVDNLQSGFAAMAANSKKITKFMQGVAVYQAVIKGKQAAVDAWQAGMSTGGPFAPAVAAAYTAASIANTASMINSIKSGGTSMGGTSTTSTSTGSSTGSTSTPSEPEQSSNKTVSINMVGGSMFSTDQVRELIGQINEAVGDGYTVNVGA